MPDEDRDPVALGGDAADLTEPWPPRPLPPADVRQRIRALTTRYGVSPARVVVGVVVVVAVSAGGWWLLRPPAPPIERTLPVASAEGAGDATGDGAAAPKAIDGAGASTPAAGTTTTSSSAPPTEVVAHAAGAVVHPGVYRLSGTARVDDLVRAAGGLAPLADGNRVNLAAPLADGERVYVPTVGESQAPIAVAGGDGSASSGGAAEPGSSSADGAASSSPGAAGGSSAGPVDLNAADADQLDTLPGVGPATAQAIITYRQEHGPFRSVDELLEVRGIGDAKLAELRSQVTIGG